jgi:catechol-2,3-dioxygenase
MEDTRAVLLAGHSLLEFTPGPHPGIAHFAFNVAPGALDLWEARLLAASPPVELLRDASARSRFQFASWAAEALYFRDCDGHLVELIAREQAPPPGSSSAIAGISEFGMAVPDVGEAAGQLQSSLGLEPYGAPSDDFCALGDPRGLLILVRAGRPWFPEGRESAAAIGASLVMQTPKPARIEIPAGPVRIEGVA